MAKNHIFVHFSSLSSLLRLSLFWFFNDPESNRWGHHACCRSPLSTVTCRWNLRLKIIPQKSLHSSHSKYPNHFPWINPYIRRSRFNVSNFFKLPIFLIFFYFTSAVVFLVSEECVGFVFTVELAWGRSLRSLGFFLFWEWFCFQGW